MHNLGRLWRTFDNDAGRTENSNRIGLLGNRMRSWTFARSLHKCTAFRAVDRQSNDVIVIFGFMTLYYANIKLLYLNLFDVIINYSYLWSVLIRYLHLPLKLFIYLWNYTYYNPCIILFNIYVINAWILHNG